MNHLNGWQRLWVVLSILWTLVVGAMAWGMWPPRDPELLTLFYSGWTPSHEAPAEIAYDDVVAHLARWTEWNGGPEPGVWIATAAPTGAADPREVLGTIPTIGLIRFPASMSRAELDAAAPKLYEDQQKLLQKINRQHRETFFSTRRRELIQVTAAVWLLPILGLYALGFSVKWVRHGFATAGPAMRSVQPLAGERQAGV